MTKKILIISGVLVCACLVCSGIAVLLSSTQPSGATPTPTKTSVIAVEQVQPEQSASVPEATVVPPSPTTAPATATPTPQPIGVSRSNPLPRTEIATVPNWEFQVFEVLRGDAAWQPIQTANQFNQPASQGWEYLLIKARVKCTITDDEEHLISGADFRVTGDKLINYSGASVVEPEPRLEAQLFSGGSAEGWIAFSVAQGESQLILIFDEILDFDDSNVRFIALDEGAAINIPSELYDIESTDLGKERANPALKGETITTEDWQLAVLETIRGEQAWQMTQEANQFNEAPADGMEYLAIKLHVRCINTKDKAMAVDMLSFKTLGSASVLYDLPSVVDPEPALSADLFPGGEYEGWIIAQAAQNETGVLLVFEPLLAFSDKNKRFLALE